MTSSLSISPHPRSLAVFFALAFVLSWGAWVPAALASHGLLSIPVDATLSALVGAFGPCCAALITTALCDGRAGFGVLFNRLWRWRVGLPWYLFVLLWPALFSFAKTGVAILLGSTPPDMTQPPFVRLYPLPPELMESTPFLSFLPLVFLQQLLIGSSMGEEPGWRGYALPRLQARQHPLHASLWLGFIWGLWHFPLWLTKGNALEGVFLGWPLLGLMAMTILFTWVFNHTRGSLLLALLFHTAIAVTGLFLAAAEIAPWLDAMLNWAVALPVAAFLWPRRWEGDHGKLQQNLV